MARTANRAGVEKAAILPALLLAALVVLSGCSTDRQQPVAATTIGTTLQPRANPTFCALAEAAADGRIAFSDPAQTGVLLGNPSLSDWDRKRLAATLDDAATQVASGVWENAQLVDLVNELCGTHLTPVTMMQ